MADSTVDAGVLGFEGVAALGGAVSRPATSDPGPFPYFPPAPLHVAPHGPLLVPAYDDATAYGSSSLAWVFRAEDDGPSLMEVQLEVPFCPVVSGCTEEYVSHSAHIDC